MKSKNMTLMAIAIGCGLVAAFLTAKLSGNSAPEKIDVIVAKKDLPVGKVIPSKDEEMEEFLGVTKFDRNQVPPDAITNAEDLKGKRLNRTMKAGNFFSPGDVQNDNGIKLPGGMYQYSIRTDGIKAVSGFVQAGDHVDVILTETQGNGRTRSGMFLRDMLVLAVDTSANRREGNQAAVMQVNAVSLAVTSKEALILSSAEKRGEVKLVLRDLNDADKSVIGATDKIPGIDEMAEAHPLNAPSKTKTVVVTRADVPLNVFVNKDNFNKYFETREVPEEALFSNRELQNPMSVHNKYVIVPLTSGTIAQNVWFSEEKKEEPKAIAGPEVAERETLPPPREIEKTRPEYPKKFVQIINNRRVVFIEHRPGEFQRLDNPTDDIKDLQPSTPVEKKEEKAEVKSDVPVKYVAPQD